MDKEIKRRKQCMLGTHEPISSKRFLAPNMIESKCKYCGKLIIASLSNYIWTTNA